MAVTVTARMREEGSLVVFVGESVEVYVTLENTGEVDETIAFCSVQVRCLCFVHRGKVAPPWLRGNDQQSGAALSSFAFSPHRGERGHCVFETEAVILCCDLTLKPNELRQFAYKAEIRGGAPPSYKGESISYSYKVAVGTQQPGTPIGLIRLPFRVLPIGDVVELARRRTSLLSLGVASHRASHPGVVVPVNRQRSDSYSSLSSSVVSSAVNTPRRRNPKHVKSVKLKLVGSDESPSEATNTSADEEAVDVLEPETADPGLEAPSLTVHTSSALLKPTAGGVAHNLLNPFRKVSAAESHDQSRQRTLYAISTLARRRKPNLYSITLKEKFVVKFHIVKETFRLGEEISGWFDFVGASVVCHQATVSLVCEEDIADKYRCRTPPTTTGSGGVTRTVHARNQILTKDTRIAAITIPIPMSCGPEFRSDLVTVKWKLQFEFLITKDLARAECGFEPVEGTDETFASTKHPVKVEKLKWSLPIHVLPTNPVHIPFPFQAVQDVLAESPL